MFFQTLVSIEVTSYPFLYQTKDKLLNLPPPTVLLTIYGKYFSWYCYAEFFRPKLLVQSEAKFGKAVHSELWESTGGSLLPCCILYSFPSLPICVPGLSKRLCRLLINRIFICGLYLYSK